MPSPFPGMDPFIEAQEWADFHQCFILQIRDVLNQTLPGGYGARVERRVYYENEILIEDPRFMAPDGVVLEEPSAKPGPTPPSRAAAAQGAVCYLPAATQHREAWLEIQEVRTRRVISLLELLSPANKTRRSRGRRLYLRKRAKTLRTHTNFIEIDLLRGGRSLLNVRPRPRGDYYVLVSAADSRPRAEIHAFTLREPLPTIAVPLKPTEAAVPLNLQDVLTSIYDRSRYREFLDYRGTLEPPLTPEDEAWMRSLSGLETPTAP